jgi:hypothetical protein
VSVCVRTHRCRHSRSHPQRNTPPLCLVCQVCVRSQSLCGYSMCPRVCQGLFVRRIVCVHTHYCCPHSVCVSVCAFVCLHATHWSIVRIHCDQIVAHTLPLPTCVCAQTPYCMRCCVCAHTSHPLQTHGNARVFVRAHHTTTCLCTDIHRAHGSR